MSAALARTPRILLDCRWLPIGGAGKLTELLLRGLRQCPPEGRWVLWGPPAVERLAWEGAEVVVDGADPRRLNGQARLLRMPSCDLAVFLHHQRPLRPRASVTVVLDTIALRMATSPVDRAVKRLFLRAVVRLSREVLTISEHSRRTISRDLGVPASDVTVLTLPYDDELVAAVQALRPTVPALDTALYVGAFLPHKNLDRLVQAFSASRFAATGGRLALVGGTGDEGRRLVAAAAPEHRDAIEIRPRCDEAELRRLFASALFLVQPSVEEGFGLPVLEALSCGLPVCVSDGGALPEVTRGRAAHFPATSVPAMTATLDECAEAARAARAGGEGEAPVLPTPAELGVVPVVEFARQFRDIVSRNLRP